MSLREDWTEFLKRTGLEFRPPTTTDISNCTGLGISAMQAAQSSSVLISYIEELPERMDERGKGEDTAQCWSGLQLL